MLRVYELSERRAQFPVLRVEYRRFYRDIPLSIRYSFSTHDFTLNASASWTSTEIGECMRQFVELVQSPHWRAEIEPWINHTSNYSLFSVHDNEPVF